ncbi:MAG TPA: biopolymer transporter ExbD [Arenimonas sp.]|uniref:ExbD/TolR family protein n=1 Tax=Arenimonas sp. TaxID=1872635 RepID=UPI002BC9D725|nr:biopolymer transporter ExbD [Arenimonas sp.]HMB58092.1 biopolymer transporter ExbD [Arenimonas sp.]
MAFASNTGGPMADINVTPLVDVMLVLLIIFMVTVPPTSYPIQVDLPQPSTVPPPPTASPDPIRIHIDAGGTVSWNGSPTPMSSLQAQFDVEGARGDNGNGAVDAAKQATIEIETDKDAEYEVLAKVLSRAKNANLVKISFVAPGASQ